MNVAELQLSRRGWSEIFRCALSAELYSYTEGPEFLLNRKCFEEDFRVHGKTPLVDLSPRRGGMGISRRRRRA